MVKNNIILCQLTLDVWWMVPHTVKSLTPFLSSITYSFFFSTLTKTLYRTFKQFHSSSSFFLSVFLMILSNTQNYIVAYTQENKY